MVTKKIALSILALAICFGVWSSNPRDFEAYGEPMLSAWERIETRDATFNLNVYGTLTESIWDQQQLESTIILIAESLSGVDVETDYLSHPSYQEIRADFLAEQEDVYVELILQSMLEGGHSDTLGYTALVANITGVNYELLIDYRALLQSILTHVGCDGAIHYSLMGVVDDLSAEEISELVYALWTELQAVTVDLYMDKQVMSLSAYTPILPDNPYGWNFNVQLALRRGPNGQDYTVWLGWPAIGHSY